MSIQHQPYRESLRATLARTLTLALVLGAVSTALAGRGVRFLPVEVLLMLWPAFGGHWVELFFLNCLRPRLPAKRWVQIAARMATWFAGGCLLWAGMYLTAMALSRFHAPQRRLAWWVGGVAFIGIELVVHLVLQLRGRDNFYNGRG